MGRCSWGCRGSLSPRADFAPLLREHALNTRPMCHECRSWWQMSYSGPSMSANGWSGHPLLLRRLFRIRRWLSRTRACMRSQDAQAPSAGVRRSRCEAGSAPGLGLGEVSPTGLVPPCRRVLRVARLCPAPLLSCSRCGARFVGFSALGDHCPVLPRVVGPKAILSPVFELFQRGQ